MLLDCNPCLAKYSTFGGLNSPLHFAAAKGHNEIVGLLLENEADVNSRNYCGQTALMQACRYGHWEVVQTLLLFRCNVTTDRRNRNRWSDRILRPSLPNARKAVENLGGLQLGSKKLFVGRAVRKAERREMLKQKFRDNFIAKFNMGWSNLYVNNLSDSVDETRLREIFGSYGQIVSAKVMRHENGKSKGFGFVCFSNREESTKAKRELNGFSVDGKSFVVRVVITRTSFITQVPAGQAHLKEKRSVQLVYKHPVCTFFSCVESIISLTVLFYVEIVQNVCIEASAVA